MNKYQCTQCPKSFQSKKDLDRHMQRVHGLTPVKIPEKYDEGKSEFAKQCAELLDKI